MSADLEAIKARCEAATPGPWKVAEPGYRVAVDDGTGFLVANTFMAPSSRDLPDARFIAHARTDVPALVAETERLGGIVDDLRFTVARLTRERDEWEANEQVQAREVDRLKAVIAGLMRDHPVVGRSFRVDL